MDYIILNMAAFKRHSQEYKQSSHRQGEDLCKRQFWDLR